MNLDAQALSRLYKTYGYREVTKSPEIKIYLYEQGRYFGADIIPLGDTEQTVKECTRIKQEYADAGFAVQVRKYPDIEFAAFELYKGFFAYEATAKRIRNKYSDFVKTQSKLNGGHKYQYINSPFRINNELAGSNDIMQPILGTLTKTKPQLLIIEASAGYGKTCTAYEILNELLHCSFCENPLMTELSRNRGANIFRYILLDEIDRVYPTLDSHLVKYEIQTGRIPLIIDGFDELLHKSDIVKSDKDEVFGEVETMLDTIGHLLKGSAKIVLTTRKTAIFAGDEFQRWLTKWDKEFDVTRFSIETPRIKDWISTERLDAVRAAQIPMENIANPVLLTYLRNLSDQDFAIHLNQPGTVVKKYFFSLHEREMRRQDLRISPDDQFQIFKNVVKMMIQFDQTSDRKAFIREIIISENQDILQRALLLYPGDQNLDILADKLVNHALLDRKGTDEDMIGFINDFVFGTFVGEIMSEASTQELERWFSPYMVEIGVLAFKVQSKENRLSLWDKIDSLNQRFENSTMFNFDLLLKGKLERDFRDTIFNSISAYNIEFSEKTISSSVFINCKFKNCTFAISSLDGVSFIGCHFEDCRMIQGNSLEEGSAVTIKCTQTRSNILDYAENEFDQEETTQKQALEINVLNELYQLEAIAKSQRLLQLMKRYPKSEQRQIAKAIESLAMKDLIRVTGTDMFIEINKLPVVKQLIGK